MSDLVSLTFQGKDTADRVLEELAGLQREHLIDLEDAVVVVRGDGGQVRLKQALPLKTRGTAQGATWGMLWGTLAPGSSALFVLFRRVTADRVLPEVAKYNPKVLRTSLTSDQDAKLRAALEQGTKGRKAA